MTEWADLLVRWLHVITGIAWIGSSFHFNWLDLHLSAPEDEKDRDRLEGHVWMIHGGGFYRFEKHRLVSAEITDLLHWVKWEAGFTLVSGTALLIIVYYLGGGVLLVDRTVSDISTGTAMAIGAGVLFFAWPVYDLLWLACEKRKPLGVALSFALVLGLAYGLTSVLSGRAAFIHVGATLGSLMAGNVWMRIIPSQRELVRATKAGGTPDPVLAARAKLRSKHNNYMTLPVVFLMISNHFHMTYGHRWNWVVLGLLVLGGAAVRHYFNMRPKRSPAAIGGVLAAAIGLVVVYADPGDASGSEETPEVEDTGGAVGAPKPIDPAAAGTLRGAVRFEGTPPPPEDAALTGGCESLQDGKVVLDRVRVRDGLLADAFVWIAAGHEGWEVPPAPETEVVVDQRGCMYQPRVLGVRTKQPVTFLNSDPLLHNVRVLAQKNKSLNLAMPARDMRLTKKFARPEVMVTARCDVHPWMGAFLGVVAHPWFAVTGDDGRFRLEGVPPGDYEVRAWHEVLGTASEKVHVGAKGEVDVTFTFPSGDGTGR